MLQGMLVLSYAHYRTKGVSKQVIGLVKESEDKTSQINELSEQVQNLQRTSNQATKENESLKNAAE